MTTTVPTQHDHAGLADFTRVPPQDLDAERAVLGALLLPGAYAADAYQAATEALHPLGAQAFYRPAHATIYAAIMAVHGRGQQADPILVAAELAKAGDLARVGGASYLHACVQEVPTAGNAAYYAEIVLEKALVRRTIESGTRLVQMGYDAAAASGDDVRALIDASAAELLNLAPALDTGQDPAGWDAPMGDLLDEWEGEQASGPAPGLPMPYDDLGTMLTSGPGNLVVVAGRPGMGKSVVLLDLVRHLAIASDMTAAFISLEMGRPELVSRLIAAEASIPQHHIRRRELDAADWDRYQAARTRIAQSPLRLVVPPGGITVAQIRAQLRKWAIEDRLPVAVAVDYLQIVKPEQTTGRGGNRTNEVDAIARGLKELAIEFNVTVFAAAQLSRATTSREEKRPQLSDLRESGEIEQAADAVVLLHREDYYQKEHPAAGEIEFSVGKNRHGATGTVTAAFQGHYSRAKAFEAM
ncbi:MULTISPECIES: replicative DNA helicase [unclassified Streptomyces]|uniref:replicative DNA helicase n=1 Tax=unclassified Streptomyces TaxID=2593676 RepID=UPI000DAC69A7|nr:MULTISPECIES: replicative DNA helicase [unclassified Streptomyces]PZT74508.1 replicative DNA helicase [Streptomyces sp. AC1-42T]PZT82506.1 replicative DNA helicase [Streptomyces sp. AC1-42W]